MPLTRVTCHKTRHFSFVPSVLNIEAKTYEETLLTFKETWLTLCSKMVFVGRLWETLSCLIPGMFEDYRQCAFCGQKPALSRDLSESCRNTLCYCFLLSCWLWLLLQMNKLAFWFFNVGIPLKTLLTSVKKVDFLEPIILWGCFVGSYWHVYQINQTSNGPRGVVFQYLTLAVCSLKKIMLPPHLETALLLGPPSSWFGEA